MSVFSNAGLGCLVLLSVACSGNDNRTRLDWRAMRVVDPNDPEGVAGVKVCVDAHPEILCATTAANGDFGLGNLPAGTELVLDLEKAGYIPSLKPIKTSYDDSEVAQPIMMYKESDLPTDLGFAVDEKGAGSIDFFVIVLPQPDGGAYGPLSGATVTLSPGAKEGAVYYAAPDKLDATLKATQSSGGNFALGAVTSGRFFNVPAGDYTVNFTAPPKYSCTSFTSPTANWGFPVAGEPAVRVPVRAGFNTANIGVSCTPKSK